MASLEASYMKTIRVLKSYNVPSTAREWQLYSDMKGAGGAAKRLTAALKKACSPNISDAEASAIMNRAMNLDDAYGAGDSEPSYIARDLLRAIRSSDYF
jgi:hypothetical protein